MRYSNGFDFLALHIFWSPSFNIQQKSAHIIKDVQRNTTLLEWCYGLLKRWELNKYAQFGLTAHIYLDPIFGKL